MRTSLKSWAFILGAFALLAGCGDDADSVKKEKPPAETACDDGADNDKDGQSDCADLDCRVVESACALAPALDRSVATTLIEASKFLYTGPDPIQKDVDEDAFDERRVAMVRGRVVDRAGQPLSGVKVTVGGHSEYGYTNTRPDGFFDLAVNGGARLVLKYELDSYVPAERVAQPGWQRHGQLPEVGMIEASGKRSKLDADAESLQVAAAEETDDAFGKRQVLVMMKPGTEATAELPDGSEEDLETLTLGITEYPFEAMDSQETWQSTARFAPGTLPLAGGVHYGMELRVDEAERLDARWVSFSKPVSLYVENFLGLPVGAPVPLGYYDRKVAQWQPAEGGRVIEILAIEDGRAVLDTDGDGAADDAEVLDDLEVTGSELTELGKRYEVGTQLWRAMVQHFSPWDVLFPVNAPPGATAPNAGGLFSRSIEVATRRGPAVIESQAMSQKVGIAGTPYSLQYQSDRTSAYEAAFEVDVPLIPDQVPPGLKSVRLQVKIAGKNIERFFDPEPNLTVTLDWNGEDAFKRRLQGPQTAEVTIGYVFDGVISIGRTFGASGVAESKTTQELGIPILGAVISQTFETQLGVWDARGYELGGFSLDVQHGYDAVHGRIFFGYGDERRGENVGLIVNDLGLDFDLGTPDGVTLAPDGSLIITDDQNEGAGRILRLTRDEELTIVAGPGAEGAGADIALGSPQGVVVAADGSIIVADFNDDAIKRILPDGSLEVMIDGFEFTSVDGIALGPSEDLFVVDADRVVRFSAGELTVFAGGGTSRAEGVAATEAQLLRPSGIAAAPDGSVFVSERGLLDSAQGGHRIRKISPDGTIRTIAGTDTAGFSGDGGDALLAQFNEPRGLTLGVDGSVYVADQENNRVRRITPDGLVQSVVGGGDSDIAEGQRPDAVTLEAPDGITLAKDGKLFVATGTTVFQVAPGLPELSNHDDLVPSVDGHTLYRFDHRGKHVETVDAMTGVTELSFAYDDAGRLASLQDKNGLTTEFERRSDGELRAIVAPFGQRTSIDLDDQGRLVTVTDVLERAIQFAYDSDAGTLTSVIDAKGGTFSFEYDELGLLTKLTDPTGYNETLSRAAADRGYAVTVTTPNGRETEYSVQALPGEILNRSIRLPDQTKADSSDEIKRRTMLSPDGSLVTQFLAPDRFFGSQAPFAETTVTRTPGGRTLTKEFLREKTLEDSENALTVQDWIETTGVNGLETVTAYSRADRTRVTTSPFGRTTTTTLDELGRKISVEAAGMPTQRFVYDDAGRVIESSLEADGDVRTTTFEYGEDGFLASTTNAIGDTTTSVHDLAGRVTETLRPDGESILKQFDENDNVLTLLPPGAGVHTSRYEGASNRLIATVPPELEGVSSPTSGLGVGETQFTYTSDNELEKVIRSDGRTVVNTYDGENGRLQRVDIDGVRITYGYDANGVLTSVNRSDSVRVTSTFDGPLATGTVWTGAVEGSVTATYDENFRMDTMTVNGASSARFTYDEDGLVTTATANGVTLALARDDDTGRVAGSALGLVSTVHSYNGFAELSVLSADFDGADLFRQDIERDGLGRVASISERFGGTTREISYSYDELGRLVEASRDDSITTYTYDLNGNRVAADHDGEELTGTYDEQDRLIKFGDREFEQTAQGDLLRVVQGDSALELAYDELGNLLTATASSPDSSFDIEYKVDGMGRRVARRVNGAFDKAWFYRDALRPVAQVDSAGIFMHFIYGTRDSAPDFILRAGTPLRVIKDHLGSVRMVVNALTGVVEQELDYDEFGRVLSDTNPGFQPFGFAGGLFDPDTGLVRFGKRDYAAGIGRWLAKDPIGFGGGDTNLYGYCANDPVNCTDPTGEVLPAWAALVLVSAMVAAISGDTYVEGSGEEELFTIASMGLSAGGLYAARGGYWVLTSSGTSEAVSAGFTRVWFTRSPGLFRSAQGYVDDIAYNSAAVEAHELMHVQQFFRHPNVYYYGVISRAPGAGLTNFALELQAYGAQGLGFAPRMAFASVQHAGRAALLARDAGYVVIGGVAGYIIQ